MRRRYLKLGAVLLSAGALQAAAGCGGGASGPPDEDVARTSLTAALDAWKAGKLRGDLEQHDPKIVVGDDAWQNGMKLVAYSIDGLGKATERDLRVPVTLTLQRPPRAATKVQVVYIVGTKPVITIFRENPD